MIDRKHPDRPSHDDEAPASQDPGDRRHSITDVTALDGGVSSDIRVVRSAQGIYVVKRALSKLRVKTDWFSDPVRSSTEVRGLRAIANLLGQVHVPKVLWADDANNQFAMEFIDAPFKNWKQQLLNGHVDMATARAAGRLLGELHTRSSAESCLATQFANIEPFVELRIRPFFERIAQRNPHLRRSVKYVVENMHASRNALVHGDYSPKNLLVDGDAVVILDCEVAHWGDARFDVAFCVAHLLLKSFRRAAPESLFQSATLAFLSEYHLTGIATLDDHFFRQLGCLILARLEGDSPVEYLDDFDANTAKQFAIELLLHPPGVPSSGASGVVGVTA